MRLLASFSIAALLAVSSPAFAQRPSTVAGTLWTVQVNNEVESLEFTTQGGPGAPGGPDCLVINGISRNVAPIRGWFCPATGRIAFVHNNVSTGAPVRFFSGHVSEVAAGQPLHLAGTVAVLNAAFGSLGEYNFSAVQQ